MASKRSSKNPVVVVPEAKVDVAGVWYNPTNSGWGVFINKFGVEGSEGNTPVQTCTIFTFGSDGTQRWFTSSVVDASSLTFDLYKPSGTGPFDSGAGQGTGPSIGTIEFTSTGPFQLAYTAAIQSAVLSDIQFSPPPPPIVEFSGTLVKLG